MTFFKPRPYQDEADAAVSAEWDKGIDSTLVAMATGLGKTEVAVQIAKKMDGRTLVSCPMLTLIGQTANKFYARTGRMPAIEQGELRSNETPLVRSEFIIGSKQSLCKRRPLKPSRYMRLKDIALVIVDEAHLSITPPYKEMLQHFRENGAKILGLTATPKRHDKRGMNQVYDSVAYRYDILPAVKDGWLVDSRCQIVQIKSLDLSGINTSSGQYGTDFQVAELNSRLEEQKTIFEIAEVTARETKGLKTVVYCASVLEARLVAERLADNHKIKADFICADEKLCPKKKRLEVLNSFTQDPKGITHVCNVGILTTGWDFPGLQAIVGARPTMSHSLHTQIYGRGTRPLDGIVDFDGSTPEARKQRIAESNKPYFRMIDLVDNTLWHKVVTASDILAGSGACDEAKKRAKKRMMDEGTEASPIDLAEEEAAKMAQEERESRERRIRARIEARAQYLTKDVDPYSTESVAAKPKTSSRLPRCNFGKQHRGKPYVDVPGQYLRYALLNFDLTQQQRIDAQTALGIKAKAKKLEGEMEGLPPLRELSKMPDSLEKLVKSFGE